MFYEPLFYVIQFIYDIYTYYLFVTNRYTIRTSRANKNLDNPREQTKFIPFLRIHTCYYSLNTYLIHANYVNHTCYIMLICLNLPNLFWIYVSFTCLISKTTSPTDLGWFPYLGDRYQNFLQNALLCKNDRVFTSKSFTTCQNPYLCKFRNLLFYRTYFLPYDLFYISHVHEIPNHTLNVCFLIFKNLTKCYSPT